MKIQTKIIDGKMMGRECNPYSANRDLEENEMRKDFEKSVQYLPAPPFDKEDVWEAEIVWQYLDYASEWCNCCPSFDHLLAEYAGHKTRQIYIPKEVKKENMEKTPLELIAAERVRKAAIYGYDDKAIIERVEDYGDGELAWAASAYALSGQYSIDGVKMDEAFFPWDLSYFKPSPNDRIKELVKAGAFIVDEIMRLQAINKAL